MLQLEEFLPLSTTKHGALKSASQTRPMGFYFTRTCRTINSTKNPLWLGLRARRELETKAREWGVQLAMDSKCSPFPEISAYTLQVLSDDDPLKDDKVLKHTSEYPSESKLLQDTALSYGGKPRIIPLPQASFIPVGHICLGLTPAHYDDPKEPFAKGSYWISNFYVSRAVQSSGLGRAAMDTAERIATSEPLNARLLGLNAINKEDPDCEEKYKALNLPIPPVRQAIYSHVRLHHYKEVVD